MATFTKKTEVVDARQFTGGVKNAREIVLWVSKNGGVAQWRTTTEVTYDGTKVQTTVTQDVLQLRCQRPKTPGGTWSELAEEVMSPGEWVIHNQDGGWTHLSDEKMKETFDEQ